MSRGSLAPRHATSEQAQRPSRTPSGTLLAHRPDVALLLAHDLKTPLATIAMNLEFVIGELAGVAPEVREAIEDCVAANARAVRIVTDMAEAARIARSESPVTQAQPTEVLSIAGAAARTLDVPAAARRAHIVCLGEPTLTHADPTLLGRALERLLEWVLRHTKADSTIEVTCADRVLSIRAVASGPMGSAGGPAASLATHYADAVLRAQGGGVWTEVDAQNVLCVTVAVPA
jgi:signal transduction histidine kinase